MDDKTKQQPVQSAQQMPQQRVQQPAQPVGGPKEMPRIGNEWVAPSTPEIVLPQEVKEAGVEAHPTILQVSQSAQQSGVRMANEAMTISPVGADTINLQTPRSVLDQLKAAHKSFKDSFSWLIRLIIREQDKKEREATQ